MFKPSFKSSNGLVTQEYLLQLSSKWRAKTTVDDIKVKILGPNKSAYNQTKYILSQFPYPSGNLHIGHLRVYTVSDVISRYYRLKGYNVIHPIGWDSFGLPAENAALERNISPESWTETNIHNMTQQMNAFDAKLDWNRELKTSSPDYYKWTQWLFLQLYKNKLAYRKFSEINWDPVDKTVLANEQVDANGRSWRSGAIVEKKKLNQWFFKITEYADELLDDLSVLGNWPKRVKEMQKNWIGGSSGTFIKFPFKKPIENMESLDVFTTKIEALGSVEYVAIGLKHELLDRDELTDEYLATLTDDVNGLKLFLKEENLLAQTNDKYKSALSKNGFLLEKVKVHHPISEVNGIINNIPVLVAPYVLSNYGPGAVMGCPAHNSKDYEFWEENKHKIGTSNRAPLVSFKETEGLENIKLPFEPSKTAKMCDENIIEAVRGETIENAQKILMEILQKNNMGENKKVFKLRDWLISRQRRWGTPIPIVHCQSCGTLPVPESQLPITIEKQHEHGGKCECPKCGSLDAKRELDTMDTFIDSSWYYFRFLDAHNSSAIFESSKAKKVDVYVGGIEHAILHLLYSRFISKFFKKIGLYNDDENGEPFDKLLTQGMVKGKTYTCPETGRYLKPEALDITKSAVTIKSTGKTPDISFSKMSKSKFNGVDPLECIKRHGPDAVKAHIIFQAPVTDDLIWDETKIVGIKRWLVKLIQLCQKLEPMNKKTYMDYVGYCKKSNDNGVDVKVWNQANRITASTENYFEKGTSLNNVVSNYMKMTALLKTPNMSEDLQCHVLLDLLNIMYPVIPNVSEECFSILQKKYNWSDEDMFKYWPESKKKI
ncbi:related to Leucine--tRNA ligase, mitochondrial [Hanseniaspora guilliermondii]|uniref:leucine--tRNA ligase n=1 Tax=Hanseniaspora guilliermondii TaxID=56406 RepID=A0A1L0B796_9ASCO|nr:related to Leucine--tRNA ligase, mitochondrial [Hanseniaspora guilliermondii]